MHTVDNTTLTVRKKEKKSLYGRMITVQRYKLGVNIKHYFTCKTRAITTVQLNFKRSEQNYLTKFTRKNKYTKKGMECTA
jgi:hypothetical protein